MNISDDQNIGNKIAGAVTKKRGRPSPMQTEGNKKKKAAPKATNVAKANEKKKQSKEVAVISESEEEDGFQPSNTFQSRRNMILTNNNAVLPQSNRKAPVKG